MPVFLILSIIFVLWLGFEIRKHSKVKNTISEDFWKREGDAYFVRPKDISSLEYLNVPIDSFPFKDNTSEAILEVQNAILKLSKKKLLNLNGLSNTDLKYQYGAKNFDELASCDQNYLVFIRTLNKWAHLLQAEGFTEDAKTILEYCIQLDTDISSTYTLLAEIYANEGNYGKITDLIQKAENLNTLMKDSILQALHTYQNH